MTDSSRNDEVIAADVRDTLRWDTRIQPNNIQVEVLDGIVTLTGNVRLLAERNIAADDAWRVKGVRQVINDIAVSPTSDRTNADIAADVENALKYDNRVDLSSIVVHVADGVVTLSGVVGSSSERQAAEEDAWYTPGVVSVANRIDVSPTKRRPDAEVLAGVREALTRDARITDATRISVSVDRGNVTLRGAVDRPDERRAAEEDAWFTAGVVSVFNHLVVSPLIPQP
jgi:osmotically-inducible protein OsmY